MGSVLLLKIGGIYNILCALLHVIFPKMFRWDKIMKLLPDDKRLILEPSLHIMNWCMAVFLGNTCVHFTCAYLRAINAGPGKNAAYFDRNILGYPHLHASALVHRD